ncbi:leucine-rich repeat-containing G-protein coupled receptor 5-like [Limulus polyphemus]|uniref:Leucine-rich repeat-containing G-protein coupled receptor 5-like n=1 Tax=Limulus polyphemus TaxID=6850 RepID=A0ABM1SBX7_LIMPO|nr:leucine-rich repeat-containing G-protein coupled receptor 5-like [Limulus polyphemus]
MCLYYLRDLSTNNISHLPDFAFRHLLHLKDLNLGSNSITTLSPNVFTGLYHLKTLSLQDNKLQKVPIEALREVPSLETLHINGNKLAHIPMGSLSSLKNLQKLWLDENLLTEVPVTALGELPQLQAVNLAANNIRIIPNYAFINLTKLVILVLQRNGIEVIEPKSFEGLYSLKVLEINRNRLKQLPEALHSLPHLQELTFADNQITHISANAFQNNPQLTLLEMGHNPIVDVGRRTFTNLPDLKELVLGEAQHLKEFPDLTGTGALEHLRLDRGLLEKVPPRFCTQIPLLKSLSLKSNRLSSLPEVVNCTKLRLIDLSYNRIEYLGEFSFRSQKDLIDLFLGNNFIERIFQNTFVGLTSLQVLDLKDNRIIHIDYDAFVPVAELRDLNLGNNHFLNLPTKGLQNLRQLKTFNNPNLKDFPPPDSFPRIHTLALSYSYHCCAFLNILPKSTPVPASLQETIVWLSEDEVDMSIWNINITNVWPDYANFSSKFGEFADVLWKSRGSDYIVPDNIDTYAEEYFEDYKSGYNNEETLLSAYPVKCIPKPGPFMPCKDLFDWWTLRCGVWIVFLLAMLGNGVVVIVLLFGRSKMDVPRFLVCNLAVADFFMGVYLGMLAVVDASTLGEFRVFAIAWQTSVGCQIAGFLGVLSTELSVYTLSVITLERNYAITHAMHLNKRLSLKHAGYIMICGWIFALAMALMPLFGISDYRRFAVCLPFDTKLAASLSYVVFLILINGVAFLILMGCYLRMYCAIRGSQAWNSNDSRIAKRMALLVFTDFICWAPIAFFSLTAVSGLNLVSLEEAKVFTVFVLPFNSCANPFLYAIFTKQFKKDCVLICKRIEESRVTRGIGRYRHSSNFSNRHTPANTNSAVEKKSAGNDLPPCRCAVHKVSDGTRLLGRRNRWKRLAMRYFMCQDHVDESETNDYTYAIARIQKNIQRGAKRASSISSENFSSRSDSWRQTNIPLRLLERGGRSNVPRKFSQDSNMSCSRQDSSSTSTFRMSRSSVSSDSSNPRPIFPGLRECPSPVETGQLSRPLGGVREKTAIIGDPPSRAMRSMVSGPRLCRQAAVDETCSQKQTVIGFDARSIQKSPSFSSLRQDVLCPSCSRSPPLTLKSKDLEEKFNFFYSRLGETSHEESSDISVYKDEQVIISSFQSIGDQKVDSSNTNDTSVPDSSTQDDQDSNVTVHPQIAINQNSTNETNKDDERDDMCQWLEENENLQQSQGMLLVNNDIVHDPSRLYVSADNVYNPKSQSMTSIRMNNKLSPSRKVASDNSFKRFSLKNLPDLLRSLSSQNTKKIQKLNVRSHYHLRASLAGNLRCSKSEITIHQHFPDNSTEWKLSSSKELDHLAQRYDSSADVYDSCNKIKCKSTLQKSVAPSSVTSFTRRPDAQKNTSRLFNEECPLGEPKGQNGS